MEISLYDRLTLKESSLPLLRLNLALKNEPQFIISGPGFLDAKLSTRWLRIATHWKPKTNLIASVAGI